MKEDGRSGARPYRLLLMTRCTRLNLPRNVFVPEGPYERSLAVYCLELRQRKGRLVQTV
jgi:hypothetical protein